MTYFIKSRLHLDEIYKVLQIKKMKPLKISENELSVSCKQRNALELALASFLSHYLFVKTIKETLQTLMFEESYKTTFLEESLEYFETSSYWKNISLILVAEYFQNSKTFNMDSFMLFNMKGFKQEVQEYVRNATAEWDEEEDESYIYDDKIRNLFTELRSLISHLDTSVYETIHLIGKGKGDSVKFQTAAGMIVDEKHLNHILGDEDIIQVQGSMEAWEKEVLLFPALVMILSVKKLIVHENVMDEVRSALERSKQMFPPDIVVMIEDCNGCSRCDQ
ncbi:hypothetical protein JOD82_001687 [Paenibacillus sp. 1182]|uniref:hypothetical protein n=1 Tax=Paenibacillus sp. 1182 TaxID=2806565 RepID=UPI001AE1296C|nr:hypothetical protein [Paenibacillus sp. 1182]MBP1308667.1 hypothetical protein [Paenibacillus sp. 1182]